MKYQFGKTYSFKRKKKHCLVKSEISFPSSCVDRFIILSRAVGYRHDLDIVHDQYLIFTLP